tara:strand:- start:83 stop:595 length:513 start_codon:yes stop_codon:yes gene_type:complete
MVEQKNETKTVVEQKIENRTDISTKADAKNNKIAIVLVRGHIDLPQPVRDTLKMLKLTRKNFCTVVEDNQVYRGMIKKVKDYVTWGEISVETFNKLVEKRGELFLGRTTDSKGKYSYKTLKFNDKDYKTYFRLSPPRKGFGRKGIKMAFNVGGGLGNRNEKINELIERML